MARLIIGQLYVTNSHEGFPLGTRVEFIGGMDNDCFTDGESITYLGPEEVNRALNQEPLVCSETIQFAKARTMAGYDPE